MVCCFCCLPGEEALARPPLIEAQSAVDEAHEVPRHAKDTQLPQEPVPGACYTVGVDVDPYGTPLGITFDLMDGFVCAVARISPMSLIAAWNQKCSGQEVVRPRDRLLKVNGQGGDGERLAKALAQGLHEPGAHALLVFQHPVVSSVSIAKEGTALGLSLHYAADNMLGGLCVKSVGSGLVKERGLAIRAGHRIMDVDGEKTVNKMLERMRRNEAFSLTVISWPEEH
ncbi:unnamed protein product [Effrenium voratum]|uniref:PDZ domain-containing protein n=1 Tax=Effrenium voratum TaxID=2562239 RepID=A0AA36ND01_9DINO|nr:unnamed protein product [Effrenium voratum]